MPRASAPKSKANPTTTSASVQDYLAAIYDLAGSGQPVIGARLAKHMGISAPAVTDLLGGQTQLMFDSSVVQYVKAGKLRALGVTSAKRSSVLPDVPTIAEAGLPGYEATAWFGILAPTSTPEPVITKLSVELNAVLRDPNVAKWMQTQGFEVAGGSPADFTAHIKKETVKWARVVKDSGATAD